MARPKSYQGTRNITTLFDVSGVSTAFSCACLYISRMQWCVRETAAFFLDFTLALDNHGIRHCEIEDY